MLFELIVVLFLSLFAAVCIIGKGAEPLTNVETAETLLVAPTEVVYLYKAGLSVVDISASAVDVTVSNGKQARAVQYAFAPKTATAKMIAPQ